MPDDSAPAASKRERIDPAVWRISFVAVLGAALGQLDATMVNLAMSSVAKEFDTSVATIQWISSGYLLAMTLVLPLSGWVVDRIGGKRLYLICFATFTLSSAMCSLAWSSGSLIAFRVLQGISGGLMAPMMQMMVARAAGKHFARVMGFLTPALTIAPVLGPVVAGLILQHASWRWLFMVNVPIGFVAIVLAVLFLPNDREEMTKRDLDWVGLALLSPGLVLFLYGSERIGEAIGMPAMAAGAAMLAGFLWWAGRLGKRALIDLGMFRVRSFSSGAVTMFLSNGLLFAGQLLFPLFLIEAWGRSPAEMGLLLVPLSLGMLAANLFGDRLISRFGLRVVAVCSAVLAFLGTLAFPFLATHAINLPLLMAAFFVRGLGQGGVFLPSISAAYSGIERRELPMATTSINLMQRLGGPILTTICATFLAWRLAAHTPGGIAFEAYGSAFWLLSGLHVLMIFTCLLLPKRLGERDSG